MYNVSVVDQGAFHLVERCEGADNIYIYFAPVLVPPGVYIGRHVLSSAHAHRIYLNCADSQWFLDGVPGFGDSIEGTRRRLKETVDSLRNADTKIITFGGSMGGYGAILYGALIDADFAIGMGTEFILNIVGGASPGHLNGRDCPLNIYEEIRNSKVKVFLYTGEGSITDLVCALSATELCGSEKIQHISVRGLMHTLPNYIQIKYDLKTFLDAAAKGSMRELEAQDTGRMLNYPELIRACYAVERSMLIRADDLGKNSERLSRIAHYSDIDEECRSFAFNTLANYERSRGNLSKAKEYATNAVNMAPDFLWNAATAVKIADDMNDIEALIKYCPIVEKLTQEGVFLNDPNATFICGKHAWRDRRDYAKALKIMKSVIAKNRHHEAAWVVVQAVYKDLLGHAMHMDLQAFLE